MNEYGRAIKWGSDLMEKMIGRD